MEKKRLTAKMVKKTIETLNTEKKTVTYRSVKAMLKVIYKITPAENTLAKFLKPLLIPASYDVSLIDVDDKITTDDLNKQLTYLVSNVDDLSKQLMSCLNRLEILEEKVKQ